MGLTPGVRALCRKLCRHWTRGGSGRQQRGGAVSASRSRCHVISLTTHPHCHKWLQDICIVLPHPTDTNPRNQELKWMFAPLSVTYFVTGTSQGWTALVFLSLLGLHHGLLWPSLLHPPTTPRSSCFHAALTSCLHCCSQPHYLVKHCQ